MTLPLNIGIAGLGTVGAGVFGLLAAEAPTLEQRSGRRLRVVAVSARSRDKDRGIDLSAVRWHDDPLALAADPAVEVVVELIGGAEGVARSLVEAALARGKPVVTANKALLAIHGTALAEAAESAGVALAFEAAVAGGIPIVKAIREGLAANAISRVFGILNGTSNYILTQMQEQGRDFAAVLAEAQSLGYAEADPGFDVDGIDAAHKLALLASLAFNARVNFPSVHVEGIRHVSARDIAFARELGYCIKLLAIARLTPLGLEQRVHPCMIDADSAIAHVSDVFNAVVVEGNLADRTMFSGRGAGAGPTASAVVADLADIASGRRAPAFGVPTASLKTLVASPMAAHVGPYYVRLMVSDRPGVIADITAVLRDERISIASLLQHGRAAAPGQSVPVVMITHETVEVAMLRALERIAGLDAVLEPARMIRIEQL